MVLKSVSQSNRGRGCHGPATTPSPLPSPQSSNVSLSPVLKQSVSVNSLLNSGWSTDGGPQTFFGHSRLSTPPDSRADARKGESFQPRDLLS